MTEPPVEQVPPVPEPQPPFPFALAPARPPPPKPYWGAWATVGLGLAVFGVMLMVEVIMTVVYLVARMSSTPDFDVATLAGDPFQLGFFVTLSLAVTSAIGAGLVVGAVKLRPAACLKEYLALRPIKLRTVLVVVGIFAVFFGVSELLDVLRSSPANSDVMLRVYRTANSPVLFWVTMVVIGPVFEEMFFRGFLFAGLRQSPVGLGGTVAVTSLAWALMHIQYDAFGMASIFVMGIALGVVRYKTDSIWSPLLMHSLNNAVATLAIVLSAGT